MNGAPLRRTAPWILSDGTTDWPFLAGIPYLRLGRDDLRAEVVGLIRSGAPSTALALLLGDRKNGAIPPADTAAVLRMIERPTSLRTAMDAIGYGPTGTYFRHRTSLPTYLSGLALLEHHAPRSGVLFEVATGIGHFLRAWNSSSGPAIGSDLLFSNLWLAQTFVAPAASLICFDASGPFPLASGVADVVLSQDSFHYLPDKRHVTAELLRVAGAAPVLLGHVHNADQENLSPGSPLPRAAYLDLLGPDVEYDDAALTEAAIAWPPVPATALTRPGSPAALAFACQTGAGAPSPGRFTTPRYECPLRVNPLLTRAGPRWPTPKFVQEYVDQWPYLRDLVHPDQAVITAASEPRPGPNAEVDRLARRRVLLDLPEDWT